MHKVLMFLKRRADLTPEAFRAYYEDHHVPLCLKYMAGVERYIRRYVDPAPGAPEIDFDVITEVWFRDRAAVDAVLAAATQDVMPDDVIADEMNFLDRAKSRFCAVSESETAMGPIPTA